MQVSPDALRMRSDGMLDTLPGQQDSRTRGWIHSAGMARCLVTSIFARSPDDPALAPLVQAGHLVEIADPIAIRSEADLVAALQGVAATIASVEPYTADVLAQADALRVISRTGVGYDAVDVPEATRRGIVVCTTPGTNHHAVADLALGLILTCARGIVAAEQSLRAGHWMPDF